MTNRKSTKKDPKNKPEPVLQTKKDPKNKPEPVLKLMGSAMYLPTPKGLVLVRYNRFNE